MTGDPPIRYKVQISLSFGFQKLVHNCLFMLKNYISFSSYVYYFVTVCLRKLFLNLERHADIKPDAFSRFHMVRYTAY